VVCLVLGVPVLQNRLLLRLPAREGQTLLIFACQIEEVFHKGSNASELRLVSMHLQTLLVVVLQLSLLFTNHLVLVLNHGRDDVLVVLCKLSLQLFVGRNEEARELVDAHSLFLVFAEEEVLGVHQRHFCVNLERTVTLVVVKQSLCWLDRSELRCLFRNAVNMYGRLRILLWRGCGLWCAVLQQVALLHKLVEVFKVKVIFFADLLERVTKEQFVVVEVQLAFRILVIAFARRLAH